MPHKRTRQGKYKRFERTVNYHNERLQRLQEDFDQQTLHYLDTGFFNESSLIKYHTYHDDILSENVNTIVCYEHPIRQGEVLIDSRLRGYYQRIT